MSSEKEIVRFHCRQVPSPFILRILFADRVLGASAQQRPVGESTH